jgi:hypothetical protein
MMRGLILANKNLNFSIKNLDQVQDLIKETFDISINNSSVLIKAGEKARDRIRNFSRSGRSLVTAARFKDISDGYSISRRLRTFQERNSPLSDVFLETSSRDPFSDVAPGSRKSNISVTGQLLDSLRPKVFPRKKRIIIEPTGTRSYGDSQGISNKQVATELADGGRPFLGLDSVGIRSVKNEILRELRKQIKKSFPKSK